MKTKPPGCFLAALILFVLLSNLTPVVSAQTGSAEKGVSPHLAAEFIHSVLLADRTIYSEYIVERLSNTIGLNADENWREKETLMLPAQFLSHSAKLSNKQNTGMSYRLMSLWPINKNNGPVSEFEKEGLKKILNANKTSYSKIINTDGKLFYEVVYPDLAVTNSCVQCHNNHPESPKKDFKVGDVMGGIHIKLALGNSGDKLQGSGHKLAHKVVANYVHSILESDRTIYSKFIVNRLQNKNVLFASENWWEDNALLLPAQFLLNASGVIKNFSLGLDFRLISLWPVNPHNGPANEFERAGLESVLATPEKPYFGKIKIGDKEYFQAVYSDRAVTPTCVSCHNEHPNSQKHDFKMNDVMGGIVVTLPMH